MAETNRPPLRLRRTHPKSRRTKRVCAERSSRFATKSRRSSMTLVVDPPDLSQSPQLTLESWQSARDSTGDVTLAWGCFSANVTEWSADATELAQGKLAELASGTTE